MRRSKHGELGEQGSKIFQELENLLGIEFYVRCPSEYAKAVKVNAFKSLDRNGKQELIFNIKGEGKYIVRPDRVLNTEEIEKIKQYLAEIGFFEKIEEPTTVIEEIEEQIEDKTEVKISKKRQYRRFRIKPDDRKAAIELAIDEIIEEEGTEVRDLITKVKRKFEEFLGIKDYPYIMIWLEIRKLDKFEIIKINNRWFRIRRKEESGTVKQTRPYATEEPEGNVIKDFLKQIKELTFSTILSVIENLSEEEKKLLLLFLRLIEA